jgi:FixJ family two-component response regulator
MSKPRRIVAVVDDDPSMLKAIEYLLDAWGFGVEVFETAETFVRREPFDDICCLVLDVHLPGMSGFDLRRLLSERGHGFPIIFITAVSDETILNEANAAGCVAFLRKPFPSSLLINAIKQAVDDN